MQRFKLLASVGLAGTTLISALPPTADAGVPTPTQVKRVVMKWAAASDRSQSVPGDVDVRTSFRGCRIHYQRRLYRRLWFRDWTCKLITFSRAETAADPRPSF